MKCREAEHTHLNWDLKPIWVIISAYIQAIKSVFNNIVQPLISYRNASNEKKNKNY